MQVHLSNELALLRRAAFKAHGHVTPKHNATTELAMRCKPRGALAIPVTFLSAALGCKEPLSATLLF